MKIEFEELEQRVLRFLKDEYLEKGEALCLDDPVTTHGDVMAKFELDSRKYRELVARFEYYGIVQPVLLAEEGGFLKIAPSIVEIVRQLDEHPEGAVPGARSAANASGTAGATTLTKGGDPVAGQQETPETIRTRILEAILTLQGTSPQFVRDTAVAGKMELGVDEVRGHLDILADVDRLKLARSSTGYSAHLLPGHKQALSEELASQQQGAHTHQRPQVFVVHGHNQELLQTVARFLERMELVPIILFEQPGEGRTIIEKLERHSTASFVVVLMTADDLGKSKKEGKYKPRARQNVVLELGYFIGKLERSKVAVLYEEGVEMPSDYHGVEYVPVDPHDAWRLRLAREFKAAGLAIDLNKL